jgi:hypothetical protein
MMNTNPNDPLVTIAEAAAHLGMKERRARLVLAKNLIRPVRTSQGIAYRLGDVRDTKQMYT